MASDEGEPGEAWGKTSSRSRQAHMRPQPLDAFGRGEPQGRNQQGLARRAGPGIAHDAGVAVGGVAPRPKPQARETGLRRTQRDRGQRRVQRRRGIRFPAPGVARPAGEGRCGAPVFMGHGVRPATPREWPVVQTGKTSGGPQPRTRLMRSMAIRPPCSPPVARGREQGLVATHRKHGGFSDG